MILFRDSLLVYSQGVILVILPECHAPSMDNGILASTSQRQRSTSEVRGNGKHHCPCETRTIKMLARMKLSALCSHKLFVQNERTKRTVKKLLLSC